MGEDAPVVETDRIRHDAGAGSPPQPAVGAGGGQHRLRRDAAAVQADATQAVALDKGHAQAARGRLRRRGIAARPAADDGDVAIERVHALNDSILGHGCATI